MTEPTTTIARPSRSRRSILIPVASLALLITLLLSTTASAVPLTITPAKPYADDRFTVSFIPTRTLAAGWHYHFSLSVHRGASQPLGSCISWKFVDTRRRGIKARRFYFGFGPYEPATVLWPARTEWCIGRARVSVREIPNANPRAVGVLVGVRDFRIYRVP